MISKFPNDWEVKVLKLDNNAALEDEGLKIAIKMKFSYLLNITFFWFF